MKNLKTNLITNQQTVTMFGKTFSVVTKELNVKKISNSEGKAFAEKLLKDVLDAKTNNTPISITDSDIEMAVATKLVGEYLLELGKKMVDATTGFLNEAGKFELAQDPNETYVWIYGDQKFGTVQKDIVEETMNKEELYKAGNAVKESFKIDENFKQYFKANGDVKPNMVEKFKADPNIPNEVKSKCLKTKVTKKTVLFDTIDKAMLSSEEQEAIKSILPSKKDGE